MMNFTNDHKLDELFSNVLAKVAEANSEKLDLIIENNSEIMMKIELDIFNRKINRMVEQVDQKSSIGTSSSSHTSQDLYQETFTSKLRGNMITLTKKTELNNVSDKANEKYNMKKVA